MYQRNSVVDNSVIATSQKYLLYPIKFAPVPHDIPYVIDACLYDTRSSRATKAQLREHDSSEWKSATHFTPWSYGVVYTGARKDYLCFFGVPLFRRGTIPSTTLRVELIALLMRRSCKHSL